MKRLEQDYREALDGLRFSDEAKERMMSNLMEQTEQRPAKRRGVRPLRAGLIAAALCILLVGTAFAAVAVYRIAVWQYTNEENAGYHVAGDIVRYPMEQFSLELQAACEDWDIDPTDPESQAPVERRTRSREETQAFLGESIPLIWPDTQQFPDCGSRIILWQDSASRDLGYIYIGTGYEAAQDLVYDVTMGVYSNAFPPDAPYLAAGIRSKTEHGYSWEMLGDYAAANGHRTEIVVQHQEDWHGVECSGYFIRSGILYQVTVSHIPRDGSEHAYTQEEVLNHLYRLLDSFPA